MSCYAYSEYVKFNGESFFTIVCLPQKVGKFPVIICRSPYVGSSRSKTDEEAVEEYLNAQKLWLLHGYAIIFQHCRGTGKSTGSFVPYIYEREDGLELRKWIRSQPFYNKELYLLGASYTASLHYATAPFENDVKGAIFEVQDSNRYRLWYRNGQMRKGHANWHFGLFNDGFNCPKNFNIKSFSELPLEGLSKRALGSSLEDFEQMLKAENPNDDFWYTRNGGIETKNAVIDSNIPILLTTGYNDFYVGGVFDMWKNLNKENKQNCAMLVSPYNHGDGFFDNGVAFNNGKRTEEFGNDYGIKWFNHIRKGTKLPFLKGAITYYRAFSNCWQSDFDTPKTEYVSLVLGDGEKEFVYDPKFPPAFKGEGEKAESQIYGAITVYTRPFEKDAFIKGKMKVKLAVSSSAPDTSFYVRISLDKGEYSYVLRHDITSLIYALGSYKENQIVELYFNFDEYAFLIKKGERIRLDISSTDDNVYVPHTNKKGKYYLQTKSQKATNRIYLDNSFLILPIEI